MNQRALDQLRELPQILEGEEIFCGDLAARGNFIVRGAVIGDGDVAGALMLAESAYWKGNVRADVVVVKGRVEGKICARTKIELRETAVVCGDLDAPVIAIETHARVEGRLPPETLVTRFTERRQSR